MGCVPTDPIFFPLLLKAPSPELSTRRRRKSRIAAITPINATAIEPIVMPAMAPAEIFDDGVGVIPDSDGLAAAEDVADGLGAAVDGATVPLPMPDGPRFAYAGQSGLGSARGQLVA